MPWLVAVQRWKDRDAVHRMVKVESDYYCPKVRVRTVVRGKRLWMDKPLFGRYFFIPYLSERLGTVLQLPCISILMLDQEQLALIPDREIKCLRDREVRGYIPIDRSRRFRNGDRVMITEGSLTGVIGYVEFPGSITTITANGIRMRVPESKLWPG